MYYRYFLIILFFIACDPVDTSLKITNNSNKPIAIDIEGKDTISIYELSCDSNMFITGNGDTVYAGNNRVESKSTLIYVFRGSWDQYFKNDSLLYIFIFDIDTLKKYSWDSIRNNNKYLEKIILTKEKLDILKWNVVYPFEFKESHK